MTALGAGVAIEFPRYDNALLAVDFEKQFVDLAESTTQIRLGAEYNLEPIALRLGTAQSSDRSRMFAGFGVNMEDSRERFDEYLEVILKLWSGEEVTFDGKYIQLDGVQVRPKPLQDPHPPVWAAALSPGSFSLVGSKGHNLLFPPPWAPSTTAIDAYRQSLAAAGHDPESKRVAALVHLYVDDDTERAKRDFEDPLIWYYRTFSGLVARPASASAPASYEHYGSLRDLTQTVTYDQLLDLDGVVVGDPETCIRKIRHLDEIYGLSDVLFWTRLGGLDHRKVMRSMELCAKHVMPRFQDGLKVG